MPGVFDDLAGLTGDHRWAQAAAVSASMVGGLTGDGARLPSDLAVLQGGRLVAAPAPGGGTGVQYGLDAQRVPVWFATACETGARSLAGKWWPAARKVQATPLGLIAASAAATAAGDAHAATSLQARAETLAQQSPTYYGDAWAALGPALLNGTINQCEGTPDG
jgi:endoglucanase